MRCHCCKQKMSGISKISDQNVFVPVKQVSQRVASALKSAKCLGRLQCLGIWVRPGAVDALYANTQFRLTLNRSFAADPM